MARLSQSSINRQQHIPTHIQQAMNQHMQSTTPAHLQRYMGDGAYVPSHAQKAIADHMEQTMPAHLKQYAGAYMEQNVINPSVGARSAGAAAPRPHAPVPDRLRLDHSNVSAEQYNASFHKNLFAPDSPATPPAAPSTAPPQPVATPPPADPNSANYGFITEPAKPPRRGLPSLPGNASPITKIAVALGGLLVLLILFVIIRGFFSGGGNTQALLTVAQDQQAMVHIAKGEAVSTQNQQQPTLSTANQNFAITAQLSLTSAQSQLLTYMKNNGKKVNTKSLNLKVSTATDKQLSDAAANSTYDATFKQLMQTQLTNYKNDLSTAYKQTKGPKGRQLLSQEYYGAQLLLIQLNSPAS